MQKGSHLISVPYTPNPCYGSDMQGFKNGAQCGYSQCIVEYVIVMYADVHINWIGMFEYCIGMFEYSFNKF